MKENTSRLRRRALALAMGSLIGTAAAPALAADHAGFIPFDTSAQVDVFVQLATPPVAEVNARALAANSTVSPADQRAHAARITAEQRALRSQLQAIGATELGSLRVGANGISVNVRAGDVSRLRALPGVKSVARVEKFKMSNVDSVPWVGANAVHTNLGVRGEGIRIAIIDSGVDYTHANFGGPGTVEAYATQNFNVIEPGTFPTAKVIGGFDFAGPTYNANIPGSVPQPDPDPLDANGHGSHVAGSAAGIGVPGLIGAGVAPEAKLYALKVFGDAGGSTGIVSQAIEWALDPNGDGDMSDKVDVINMSLGAAFGSPEDPTAITATNAVRAGIIVIGTTGNSGDIPYVSDSPGIAPGVINVAANVPGGRIHARVTVNAPASIAGVKFNEEGTSGVRVGAPITDTVVEATPLDGCAALTNGAEINGNIALIQRGTCNFVVKVQNAQAAGARAVVLFNNVAGDPITAGGLAAATIPQVMVNLADGTAIAAQATTSAATSPVTATLDTGLDPTKDDRIVGFSSRGPGGGGSVFAPDISAPGIAIISTGVGEGNGPAPNQGTSMSAPHVTGSAALLHQLKPTLQPETIKAILMNSTVDGNPSGDTDLARHGVGALRVDRAASLTSFALPAGVSFGRINPTAVTTRSETVYLENMKRGARTFNVTHVPHQTYPGVTVTCPSSLTVGSRDHRNFTIKLRFDPKASATAGAFDNASVSQTEVDGWCVLNDGTDNLRVGYMAVLDAASNLVAQPGSGSKGVTIRNKGPAIGFAEGFTLAGSGGEGADDTYSSITHLGARRADPAAFFGLDVIEFGLVVDESIEHVANLSVDLFLDLDRDGTDDVQLLGRDWTVLDPVNGTLGQFVSAQIGAAGGFIDWLVNSWDFNDRVLVLPFTLEASGGFVPESFDYRLEVTDRAGNVDVQSGSFDLGNEVVPDLNSFGLAAGDAVNVDVTGSGRMLWLFPTNNEWYQEGIVFTTDGN